MCRNIRTLYNFEPPATDDEIQAASLQFVRKVSGFTKPSQANEEAFDRAVEETAAVVHRLLDALVTNAPPKTVRRRPRRHGRAPRSASRVERDGAGAGGGPDASSRHRPGRRGLRSDRRTPCGARTGVPEARAGAGTRDAADRTRHRAGPGAGGRGGRRHGGPRRAQAALEAALQLRPHRRRRLLRRQPAALRRRRRDHGAGIARRRPDLERRLGPRQPGALRQLLRRRRRGHRGAGAAGRRALERQPALPRRQLRRRRRLGGQLPVHARDQDDGRSNAPELEQRPVLPLRPHLQRLRLGDGHGAALRPGRRPALLHAGLDHRHLARHRRLPHLSDVLAGATIGFIIGRTTVRRGDEPEGEPRFSLVPTVGPSGQRGLVAVIRF